jgi:diaminopimelate epimerase
MTMTITKAHAYGNDFLFAHRDDLRGHDPAALSRTLCARHTGIGGDGLILYSFTPAGATMRLINADGSPSELSACAAWRRSSSANANAGAAPPMGSPPRSWPTPTPASGGSC